MKNSGGVYWYKTTGYSKRYWYFINSTTTTNDNNNDDDASAGTITATATTNNINNYNTNNVILIKIIITIKMKSGYALKKLKVAIYIARFIFYSLKKMIVKSVLVSFKVICYF